MSNELNGKVALVSGASRGQGASHARLLASSGASVVCADVLDDLGIAVADQIVGDGGTAVYSHLDVRSNSDWEAGVALAQERFGRLDILVNNAGVVGVAGVDECSDQEWDDVIAVNQTGQFRGIRAAIPALRRAGGGSIINTASVYGLRGVWGYAAYVASKHAVIGLTKSTAIQYGPENIRANAICPSAVQTPMLEEELKIFEANPDFDWQQWLETKPIPRVAESEEISEMVLYLASSRSAFITGSTFTIDGGYCAA
jgi:3alpha(or 20beta)-hydroxysteroid dehydrogenase